MFRLCPHLMLLWYINIEFLGCYNSNQLFFSLNIIIFSVFLLLIPNPHVCFLGLDLYFQIPAQHFHLWILSKPNDFIMPLHWCPSPPPRFSMSVRIISSCTNAQNFVDILDSYSFSLRPFHSDLPLYYLCPISVKPWYLPPGPRTLLPANLPNSDLSQS